MTDRRGASLTNYKPFFGIIGLFPSRQKGEIRLLGHMKPLKELQDEDPDLYWYICGKTNAAPSELTQEQIESARKELLADDPGYEPPGPEYYTGSQFYPTSPADLLEPFMRQNGEIEEAYARRIEQNIGEINKILVQCHDADLISFCRTKRDRRKAVHNDTNFGVAYARLVEDILAIGEYEIVKYGDGLIKKKDTEEIPGYGDQEKYKSGPWRKLLLGSDNSGELYSKQFEEDKRKASSITDFFVSLGINPGVANLLAKTRVGIPLAPAEENTYRDGNVTGFCKCLSTQGYDIEARINQFDPANSPEVSEANIEKARDSWKEFTLGKRLENDKGYKR